MSSQAEEAQSTVHPEPWKVMRVLCATTIPSLPQHRQEMPIKNFFTTEKQFSLLIVPSIIHVLWEVGTDSGQPHTF